MSELDGLKAEAERLKKLKEEACASLGKKYVTKAELEAYRLKKIRAEEEAERAEKERKRKQTEGEVVQQAAAKQARATTQAVPEETVLQLPRDEVIRRLRKLKQPATLFGEEDYDRIKRLVKAEKELQVEDEAVGGQQENLILELERQERERQRQARAAADAKKKAADQEARAATGQDGESSRGADGTDASLATTSDAGKLDPLAETFKRAAQQLAAQRAEEAMSIEDRIAKWIRQWCKEWEEDLEKRPEEVKQSGSGHQTTLMFKQTMKNLELLYVKLKDRSLHDELRTGLWMMVDAMRQRNYMYANDIYLKLAIGNSPWPIGVTQVGIHERSAREKISHSMNSSGIAHVMNDEATRKFLQGVKRLITFVQRAYPTDPSRSANFQPTADLGRGIQGGGSDKLALLEAEARGEDWQTLGLAQAPHFVDDRDGSIKIPTKWKYTLERAHQVVDAEQRKAAALKQQGHGTKATGSRATPPPDGAATPPPGGAGSSRATPPPEAVGGTVAASPPASAV